MTAHKRQEGEREREREREKERETQTDRQTDTKKRETEICTKNKSDRKVYNQIEVSKCYHFRQNKSHKNIFVSSTFAFGAWNLL